jgi:ABC-type nitrate/sulfonate/bicarbonate transport system ATPase subunit
MSEKELKGPFLSVEGLQKAYGEGGDKLEILRQLSFQVRPGEFLSIVGPSGCGKSTLFNILAGLIPPDRGVLRLDGTPVANLKGRVAYMQQKDLLLPWRNVLDNAILGMEIQGVPKSRAREEARQLLETFGLKGFEDHLPRELSGGMRQRVALMRTILCHKEILLLDEPFGALDAITRAGMQRWLLEVWMRFRQTVLLVTHDVEESLLLSDRVLVMSKRPGRIEGEVHIPLDRPRDPTHPEVVSRKARILNILEKGQTYPS